MHTIPELGSAVPAFLAKLWKLVEDPETDDLICWSPNGKSFFIRNQAQFARELLPHYYKHNNMASFVRQLNMYGFHKKVSVDLGGLKCDKDEMEFAHQFFYKGHPYQLQYIKRKIASSKTQDSTHTPIKPELMNKMLAEVRNMRGRQESLDNKLGAMKHANEALWRELAMLRQKHIKQQQIVNKLIHFLVTLVQPSSRGTGLSVKRRYPLMINDSSQSRKQKLRKTDASSPGPVIHELDVSEPDLDSEYIVDEMLENENGPIIHSPEHIEVSINDDNMKTIHLADESTHLKNDHEIINSQKIDAKERYLCKDKKKRKTKIPMKIFIPQLENEDKMASRKEVLEIPKKKEFATIDLSNQSVSLKSIPIATMRSSKLAAMAANISKCRDIERDDMETSLEIDDTELDDMDEVSDNDASTLVNLKHTLIVPEIINNSKVQNYNGRRNDKDTINEKFDQVGTGKSVLMANNERHNKNGTSKSMRNEENYTGGASTSSSKDLSLSCINSSEPNYREEMDTHLESMQSDLDNLRELLRSDSYSIDANTILGLFGADDPMTFELPINPELNPNCAREDDDTIQDSVNRSAGGELMAYNPTSTLLDFDDDIFLNNASLDNASHSLGTPISDLSVNNLYTDPTESLDLEDSKTSLLDSLVTNNTNSKS